MSDIPVVITGAGVVSPLGLGCQAYWRALLEGRSGIVPLSERTDKGPALTSEIKPEGLRIGSPILEFDPKQWVRPRKALKVMCREIQTSFAASQMAVEDAGLKDLLPAGDDTLSPSSIGTVFGSEMFYGDPEEIVDAMQACMDAEGVVDPSRFGTAAIKGIMPLWMLKYLPNMPACHVGISINAQGPNNTQVLGDISGPAAFVEAASCIRRGIADIMVSGAVGTRINATRLNYRGDLPVAEIADPVADSSRPHDPNAKGIVGGEAAAAFVLESSASAEARGARCIARLLGSASRFVPAAAMLAKRRSASLDGQAKRGSSGAVIAAIEAVLEQTQTDASQVGLVVGHAMGDPVMDAAEREALAICLPKVPLAAPIASLGHTGAASGMLELLTAALAILETTVPPTRNADRAQAVNLKSEPEPLRSDRVLCLTHTPEGGATAILLGS